MPEIVTLAPATKVVPAAGELIVEAGGVTSVEAVAVANPVWRPAGCTPMSANRFTVACCMARSGVVAVPLCFLSRPQDHWTV
ncbi:MAG TPA: hypothetical protein VL371_19065, partial [Gemmataceae bacterium]|nr:hypothetical protein [Gemmataceae bacterium]